MKNVKSFLNICYQQSKMLCQETKCWILIVVFVLSILCTSWGSASTTDISHAVDSIADGLIATEAQFTNLRLEYVLIHRAWNKPKGPMLVTEGIYAEKKTTSKTQRLRYLHRKVYYVVDVNQERTDPHEDTLASFDGQATRILYRKNESGKSLEPMKGYILPGYEKQAFPDFMGDPHTTVCYYAGRQLGRFLKQQRDKFYVESQNEALNGIPTVKIAGTLGTSPNKGESQTMKLWISPERNFLPLKIQRLRSGGELSWETELCDLVQLPNGMWYPKIIRSPADPPGTPKPPMLQIYNISKISIDPLPDKFFEFKFPPNTRVIDDILKITYITKD